MQIYAITTTSFGRYVFDYLIQRKPTPDEGI
jgi:hypothetical protein